MILPLWRARTWQVALTHTGQPQPRPQTPIQLTLDSDTESLEPSTIIKTSTSYHLVPSRHAHWPIGSRPPVLPFCQVTIPPVRYSSVITVLLSCSIRLPGGLQRWQGGVRVRMQVCSLQPHAASRWLGHSSGFKRSPLPATPCQKRGLAMGTTTENS